MFAWRFAGCLEERVVPHSKPSEQRFADLLLEQNRDEPSFDVYVMAHLDLQLVIESLKASGCTVSEVPHRTRVINITHPEQ